MKISVRVKLFIVSVGLILVSFAAAGTYLTAAVDAELTEIIRRDLLIRAGLIADEAASVPTPMTDAQAWDELADRLGRASHVRVTFITQEGAVVGDSEVDLAALSALENHRTRPEVVSAFAEGEGASSRLSTTIHQRMMYAAVPIVRRGNVVGVARVAEPLRMVDQATARVTQLIALASVIALVIATLMSSVAAQWMSRGIGELTKAARKMTAGDLEVRTHIRGNDEVGELGRALDQLAGSLSRSLEELRAERDLQGSILEGMEEGVLVTDGDGRVVMMNRALREMLLAGPSVTGKLLIEAIRHAELHGLVKGAAAGRTAARAEIELPGIKPRRLLTHASALSAPDGGVVTVFVDVTDLRRLESMRRDFVANVSHELRTPVTAVRSAAETLRSTALGDPDPAAALRFVDIVERNAARLQSLIEDLLELSRLESHEFRLRKERVDLHEVIGNVVGLFREAAERKRIGFSSRIANDMPSFQGDSRALEQVVSNLVDNAVKYCPSGSALVVTVVAKEKCFELSVKDSGPGIELKHIPRLFERFYRVDAGRSREVGGTGLGLSIVKHLVEAMGGTVRVESSLGEGSTFIVSIPRVPLDCAQV